MSAEALEKAVEEAQAAVAKQGDTVRSLKAELKEGKIEKTTVDAAIASLKNMRLELESKQQELEKVAGKGSSQTKELFRAQVSGVLERRLFYIPSFRIYNSVAGFYDYGPPGCSIKQNVTQAWRQHFVLEENMLELECPAVTPEVVLKASGHVERFTDFMVTDTKTGECYRADHLLEHHLEAILEDKKNPLAADAKKEASHLLATVGELSAESLGAALTKYDIKAPDTANDISPPFAFNLMFKTSIGPKGDLVGYLRPETAQGIFVNFRDLLYYNGGKLPFAGAQIGNSYRNEISPRAGLLRVREFTQAEIEHFMNPAETEHPKFASIAQVAPLLYSRSLQMGDEKKPKAMSLGDAVANGIIDNQTLGYFIGRTYLFLEKIGINPARMRFRQHLQHEMAHYSSDCWDAEVETSYGWVECVGLAYRGAYDLTVHSKASKIDLNAHEKFAEPRMVEQFKVSPNRKLIGTSFKKEAKAVTDFLEGMPECDAMELKAKLEAGPADVVIDGATYTLTPSMVGIEKKMVKMTGRNYTPAVVEPSFGIGRIMYAMFEHAYYCRDGDESRSVFRFTNVVAPSKACVFPLLNKPELNEVASKVSTMLTATGLSNIVDTTGNTIGKRYARTDELGIPFAVTVDYQVKDDDTVTLRERDSMGQVRVPVPEIASVVRDLVFSLTSWEDVKAKYPAQAAPAADD